MPWIKAEDRIFVSRLFFGDLLVCHEHTLKTLARIPLEPGLRNVCYIPERNLIVVGNYFNGMLHFIDGKDYKTVRSVWVGTKTRSILYAPRRDRIYLSTHLRILELDPTILLGRN